MSVSLIASRRIMRPVATAARPMPSASRVIAYGVRLPAWAVPGVRARYSRKGL